MNCPSYDRVSALRIEWGQSYPWLPLHFHMIYSEAKILKKCWSLRVLVERSYLEFNQTLVIHFNVAHTRIAGSRGHVSWFVMSLTGSGLASRKTYKNPSASRTWCVVTRSTQAPLALLTVYDCDCCLLHGNISLERKLYANLENI
jgi:hypothetical protein